MSCIGDNIKATASVNMNNYTYVFVLLSCYSLSFNFELKQIYIRSDQCEHNSLDLIKMSDKP